MELPDQAWISALPTGAQIAYMAGILLATVYWGVKSYLSHARKEQPAPGRMAHRSDDVIIPYVQIADMQPVRELVTQVTRLADAQEAVSNEHKQLREMFGEWMTEEEIERRIRQRSN